MTFAIGPAIIGDGGDTVKHQHGWQREFCKARTKQLATPMREQFFIGVAGLAIDKRHGSCSSCRLFAFLEGELLAQPYGCDKEP